MTTNVNSLKKSIEELKAKRETNNKKYAYDVFEDYCNGILTWEEAMELLNRGDYLFGDMMICVMMGDPSIDKSTKKKYSKV